MSAWLRVTDSDGAAYIVPETHALKIVAETETDDDVILTLEACDGSTVSVMGRKEDR